MRCIVRFAPAYDPRFIDDARIVRETMVERGAIKRLPGKQDEPIPLLVDHDFERQVGTVDRYWVADDVAGGAVSAWWFASCELADPPPSWLKPHCGVSWGFKALHKRSVEGIEVVVRALISEISVLSTMTPAEPRARVGWVGKASVPNRAPKRDNVFSMDEIRRRIEAAEATGVRGAVEMEVAFMRGLEERARAR